MNPLHITRHSLLYRLALHSWYGGKEHWLPRECERIVADSCTFIRRLFVGLLYALFHVGWISLLMYMPLDFILWVSVCLLNGTWFKAPFFAFGFIAISGAIMLTFTMVWLSDIIADKLKEYHKRHHQEEDYTPAAATKLFQSWKDKFCIPIVYEEPDTSEDDEYQRDPGQ